MAAFKKNNEKKNDLLSRAQNQLVKVQAGARGLGVCEFVETIVDDFTTPLFLSQRVILKGIFGEDLDDTRIDPKTGMTEQQLMDKWVELDKTNWKHPVSVLGSVNMTLALEDEPRKEKFKWQNVTLQCGMRCLSGGSYLFVAGKGYTRLDELLPTATEDDIQSPLFGRVQTRFGMKPMTDGLSRTPKETRRVVTSYGYEIEGSLEHPLLVESVAGPVWKQMGELVPGDRLCIACVELPAYAYPSLSRATWGKPDTYQPVPGCVMRGARADIRTYLTEVFWDSEIATGCEEFTRQVQLLLAGLGLTACRRQTTSGSWTVSRENPVSGLFFDALVSIENGKVPVYDICVPDGHEYVANGIVSHNSSKSSAVGLAVTYQFFQLITSPCPQDDYGIPRSSLIYITVLASTERQTLGTIFAFVKSYITRSTYFKTLIDNGEIIVTELSIEFPAKNIIIASGHSKATSIVGRTAIMVAFDELAMFSADDGHTSNAADVYQRVGMSAMTFPDDARRIALSSVKERGDFMETLVEEDWDRQDNGCLVFDLTTFDVNPTITKKTALVKSVYDRDPVVAERDFENIRPGAISAYLNKDLIEKACAGFDPQSNIIYRTVPLFRKKGEALALDERPVDFGDDIQEMSGLETTVLPYHGFSESIGHVDMGVVNDSFGFACGHSEWSPAGMVSVIDIVLEWMPRQLGRGKVAKVDLINAEEIISEIARARKMTTLTYDTWNSESSIQRLYREGITTYNLSFARGQQNQIYDIFKQKLALGLVRFPNHPALIEELENLELRNGESIDHPKKKESKMPGKLKISKDLADCLATVVWHLAKNDRDFVRGQDDPYGGQTGSGMVGGHGSARHTGTAATHRNINWRPR